jgi:hypothetical protein
VTTISSSIFNTTPIHSCPHHPHPLLPSCRPPTPSSHSVRPVEKNAVGDDRHQSVIAADTSPITTTTTRVCTACVCVLYMYCTCVCDLPMYCTCTAHVCVCCTHVCLYCTCVYTAYQSFALTLSGVRYPPYHPTTEMPHPPTQVK